MKNLIERYVYDVTRRLPENQREEVKNELLSNIDDMLGEKPTEQEIEQVLLSLGHPRKLANSYRGKQRYLIGPEWMDDYLMVLKIVVIELGAIGFIASMVGSILDHEATTVIGIFAEVFAETISGTFNAILQGFAIVTIIFILIEGLNKSRNEEFKVKNLPEVPVKKSNEIKRAGTITSLVFMSIFGTLFIYLLATDQFRVIWFDEQMNINLSHEVFTAGVVSTFLPLFIFSFVVTIAAEVFKLLHNRWDIKVFAVHSIAKVVSAIVTIMFITTPDLLNLSLITEISEFTGASASVIDQGTHIGFIVLAVLTGLGTITDIISTWFKKVNR